MFTGHWRYVLAALGLVVAATGSGIWVYYLDNPVTERRRTQEHQRPPKPVSPPAERIARSLEAIEQGQNSQENEDRARRDLDAQEGAWRWTKWAVWVAAVQAILSGVGIAFVVQSLQQGRDGLNAARRALRHARKANEITQDSQRAWISLKIDPQLLLASGDELYFRINLIAQNIGQTIATHFELRSEIFFLGQHERAQKLAVRIEQQVEVWKTDQNSGRHWALIPNDIEVDNFWQSRHPPEFTWLDGPLPKQKMTKPVVLAAVFYRTISAPHVIQVSWRAWYLSSVGENGETHTWIPKGRSGADQIATDAFRTSSVHEEHPANDGTGHRNQ